tara:strand:+ start:134 stop:751 length:618 start_codon:yes stop_codon:yes gene_type:complete
VTEKDNLELVEILSRLHKKEDLSFRENLSFFSKITDRLNTARYKELHFGLSDVQIFEYLTMSYFKMQSDDIFLRAKVDPMFQKVFQKLSSNRYWNKREINKKYDLFDAYKNGIRRSKNRPKFPFRDANLISIKSYLPLLGKENVIGYVVNQEHLDSLDIRLIDAVLSKDNEEVLALDTLKKIIIKNNWPRKNLLELYLKCKNFYG